MVNFPHQVALVCFLSLNVPLRWRGNQQFIVWETKESHDEFLQCMWLISRTQDSSLQFMFSTFILFYFILFILFSGMSGFWCVALTTRGFYPVCLKKKKSYNQNVSIILYPVWGKYFRSLGMQDLSFLSRDRTQTPLQWKLGVLTTRSPTE